jgi:hypothetical protein
VIPTDAATLTKRSPDSVLTKQRSTAPTQVIHRLEESVVVRLLMDTNGSAKGLIQSSISLIATLHQMIKLSTAPWAA